MPAAVMPAVVLWIGKICINNDKVPKLKTLVFATRVDQDEAAHNEPPHLDLHCLPINL